MSDHDLVTGAVDPSTLRRTLQRLIRVPSYGGREAEIQAVMAEEMADRGLEVDAWDADLEELAAHPEYSSEVERDRLPCVVGTLRGTADGPTLILNGHVDVVPPGDATAWERDPFSGTFEAGRVHGRGAVDMKGGLAAALTALQAIRDTSVPIRGRVLLHSVAGEEDGGAGTLGTILRGHTGDAAIVMEPTGLAVVPVQAGALSFRITVRGRAAHGAMPQAGVDAIEKFLPIQDALRRLERERNQAVTDPLLSQHERPLPISIGTLRAGDWPSSVPDVLVCEGRYGIAPDEGLAEARAQLEDAVSRAGESDPWLADHRPEVEWWGGVFRPASTSVDHPVVSALIYATRAVTGRPAPLAAFTSGTDLRLLAGVGGAPGVLYGPGRIEEAHVVNEAVEFEDVLTAARVLAVTILEYCGC